MREMKIIMRSPQGTRHIPGYANEGNHRSALHNESISQALAKKWLRERLQERCDTPSGTAMMILDLTVLSFARIIELHIALSAQQKYDFAEEQTVCRALQEWLMVYVRDSGDQVSLLEIAVGVKRPRIDGEGDVDMVADDAQANDWVGVTWNPKEPVPAAVRAELAQRLECLLEVLAPLECGYRQSLLADRQEAMAIEHAAEMEQLMDMATFETKAIMFTGVPTGISIEKLGLAYQLIAHVNGLTPDLEQSFVSLNEGTWSREPMGKISQVYFALAEPSVFAHNAPKRTHGITPMVSEVKEYMRKPDMAEGKGNFLQQQTWFMQAVHNCRLDPANRYVDVAVVRGTRFGQGSLEASFAILSAILKDATREVVTLFPTKHPMLYEIRNRMHWLQAEQGSANQRMQGASEIFVQLAILAEDVDDQEYASQLRNSILGGDSTAELERQGFHFIACSSKLTPQFNNNYPAKFVDVHEGATSVINCVRRDLGVHDINSAFVRAGSEWRSIQRWMIHRIMSFDDATGAWTANPDSLTDSITITWFSQDEDEEQEAGFVSRDCLSLICETDKHGEPHGAHLPLVGIEPGLASKRAENNLIVRQLEVGRCRIMHPRGDMKKKKTGGGGLQIGGIPVKNFVPQGQVAAPNTPGSNTSTPMRIPSAIALNRTAENNRTRDSARNANPAAQRDSMRAWMTPVPRPQNASMLSRAQFPPLAVTRVATMYDSSGGGGRLITTQQQASTVATPANFSLEAINTLIQGERANTQALITAGTEAVRASVNEQIAALKLEATTAREETAKAMRDLQASQNAGIQAAVSAGIRVSMGEQSFFDRLANAILTQQTQPAAHQKDDV
jgi:hypothetical protein